LSVPSPVAGKRCLVLDDEFLIALDIQQILEHAGAAQVDCVASASEAMKLLGSTAQFDVAILDIKLSEADGTSLGVAAALASKNTPFILLTGMRTDDVHARRFPDVPVVEKPYDAATLLAAIARAFSGR
jgi:two-component system, response regulator PdtaR